MAASLSLVRSVAKELSADALPSTPMGPVFVQQLIAGVNVRVRVVGDRTFACRIESDAVDYRYAAAALSETELDADLAARCVALTRALGLLVSGIDLIVTAEDAWYCLEVNPNRGFTAFDRSGDQVIAPAVAELLTAAPRPPRAGDGGRRRPRRPRPHRAGRRRGERALTRVPTVPPARPDAARERRKPRDLRGFSMRRRGLEPPRAIQPTRPSIVSALAR